MISGKRTLSLLIALLLAASIQNEVRAASVDVAAIKAGLDKSLAGADAAQASQIQTQYSNLLAAQKEELNLDATIKTIHYKNEEALIVLRKQIGQIDADKISKLDAEAKQTRERYQTLFSLSSALNLQINAAKNRGNKSLTSMLRTQADLMKPAVQLARADIKAKENKLQSAKESAANKKKSIRGILADIDLINVQIKARRSSANNSKTRFASEWKSFNQALKKSDLKNMKDLLAALVSLSRQIIEDKQKICTFEKSIGDIINKARAKL